jgi:poly-gamma-glutamate synthesis protein (capsule biosynthesis protein)
MDEFNRRELTVSFFGDFCQEGRTKSFSLREYESSFKDLVPLLRSTDYSIVNLECSPSISRGAPISKIGPHLCCNEVALHALKCIGFHCLALANNHFADYGSESVKESIQLIESLGFDYVGAGYDIESAKKTLMISLKEKRIAIINCCEHEFTVADSESAGCNPLDIINLSESIHNASCYADYVFVYIHGGNEHYQLPSPRMQNTYRFLVDCGADVVVNCHQHCISGYEYYKGKPIVYGLGNFFFDSPEREDSQWNYGYVLQVSLTDTITIHLFPYKQCGRKPVVTLLNSKEKVLFDKRISDLNLQIQSPTTIRESYENWAAKNAVDYLYSLFPPIRQSFFSRKWNHLVERFSCYNTKDRVLLTEDTLKVLYSFIHCESHREVLLSILTEKLNITH